MIYSRVQPKSDFYYNKFELVVRFIVSMIEFIINSIDFSCLVFYCDLRQSDDFTRQSIPCDRTQQGEYVNQWQAQEQAHWAARFGE